jgi:hypothetical protein
MISKIKNKFGGGAINASQASRMQANKTTLKET